MMGVQPDMSVKPQVVVRRGGGVVLMRAAAHARTKRRTGCAAACAAQLHCDSRKVGAGDGFIAWPGAATDGRKHRGRPRWRRARPPAWSSTRACEAFGFDARRGRQPTRGLKAATGPIAAAYYGQPTERSCDVLAVTGTNGKTSTAWWLAQALSALPGSAWPCAVVGTLGIGRPPHVRVTPA